MMKGQETLILLLYACYKLLLDGKYPFKMFSDGVFFYFFVIESGWRFFMGRLLSACFHFVLDTVKIKRVKCKGKNKKNVPTCWLVINRISKFSSPENLSIISWARKWDFCSCDFTMQSIFIILFLLNIQNAI